TSEMRSLALEMALVTLEKMALGGIHDHVGGGFHRYSTDDHWLLPHFEKMLYDNALMLGNFALAAKVLGEDAPGNLMEVARGISEWVTREMTTGEGLYCAALDADSEGVEGRFYVWTAGEIREVLGAKADKFIEAFAIEERGNFEDEATHRR